MSENTLTRFKLSDQTTIGTPTQSILNSIASDKTAMKLNDPLYSWYMQALPMMADPNTKKIYETVIGVVNRNRRTQEKTKELSADIVKRIENLYSQVPSKSKLVASEVASQGAKTTGTPEEEQLFKKIQNTLGMSPLPTKVGYNALGGGNRLTNFAERWRAQKAAQKAASAPSNPPSADDKANAQALVDKLEDLNRMRIEYENDPIISPDNAKITSTDRVIFIAVTFVLRAIAIFLVEWAVNTFMVHSFEDAFKMYIVCYVALFTVWGVTVNASKSLFFRMLFYYIDSESHGYGRMIVHLLVQLLLLPIPYIVRTKGYDTTEEEFTYEKRRKAMTVLSNFTFFAWVITSVIALRY